MLELCGNHTNIIVFWKYDHDSIRSLQSWRCYFGSDKEDRAQLEFKLVYGQSPLIFRTSTKPESSGLLTGIMGIYPWVIVTINCANRAINELFIAARQSPFGCLATTTTLLLGARQFELCIHILTLTLSKKVQMEGGHHLWSPSTPLPFPHISMREHLI